MMHAAPSQPAPSSWVDARFVLALVLPLGLIANLIHNPRFVGWGAIIVWLLIAVADHFIPGAQTSPEPRGHGAWHRWILRLYVVQQAVIFWLAAGVIASFAASANTPWVAVIGVAFGVGWLAGAQGITFAHELGHSRSAFDRFLGWVLMTSVWYAHFMVEHYRGHHPRAATLEDPASARRGENVYSFWVRTVTGSLLSAWDLEAKRLAQMKKTWLQSPLLWATVVQLSAAALLLLVGHGLVLLAWLIAGFVAFSLLEVVNYIEHYGLQRRVIEGKREPFNEMHAWNADHFITNALLANLQRHSDHHARAWKPYGELQHCPAPAPQLPTGYAGCVLLALVPPLWFSVMDKRLDDLSSAQTASASV